MSAALTLSIIALALSVLALRSAHKAHRRLPRSVWIISGESGGVSYETLKGPDSSEGGFQ